MKPGKGAAFVRSKLKNYVTGNTVERTFRAGESVGTADIERIDTQFTYGEGDTVRRGEHLLPRCKAGADVAFAARPRCNGSSAVSAIRVGRAPESWLGPAAAFRRPLG